ncbi:MAG: HAD-IB family hydrolase [Patescibacteria group bacterium]
MEKYPSPSTRVALFDVCKTLVNLTTVTDFTDSVLLSRQANPRFQLGTFLVHQVIKFGRYRLRLVGSDTYRRHLVSLYRGYSEQEIDGLARAYMPRLINAIHPGMLERLETLRREGYRIFLVSGGLEPYLKPFAEHLRAELVASTLTCTKEGIYIGTIAGTDCLGEGKVTKLKRGLREFDSIDWTASTAFGDSATDIPILSLVGHPVAVNPDQVLEDHARANEWEIVRTL